MRLALAIIALTASAASAQAAEDRYGPSATAAPTATAASSAYAGPTLSWSGKSPAPAPQSAPTTPLQARPAPMPGGLYRPASAAPQAAPMGPAPAAYTPPAAAPQSLYSRPAPQARAAALPPPPSPTAVQGGLYASSGPRFYSVHRPYGETPDAIPAPPAGDRMVYRPEASLAGAVALSGVGDGIRQDDADDGGMAGVGAADEAEDAERTAKRAADRAAARRAAAGGG